MEVSWGTGDHSSPPLVYADVDQEPLRVAPTGVVLAFVVPLKADLPGSLDPR